MDMGVEFHCILPGNYESWLKILNLESGTKFRNTTLLVKNPHNSQQHTNPKINIFLVILY